MRAGRQRHTVIIQSPGGSRDAVGERTTTWTPVDTVRASITPTKADERFISPQFEGSITHRLRVRYGSELAAIDNSWRVVFGARIFVINGVRDIEERHHELELLCTEGLREE